MRTLMKRWVIYLDNRSLTEPISNAKMTNNNIYFQEALKQYMIILLQQFNEDIIMNIHAVSTLLHLVFSTDLYN